MATRESPRAASRSGARFNRQQPLRRPRHRRGEALLIRARRRRVTDRVDCGAEGGACARIVDWRQAVVHPRSITTGLDQPRPAEIGEVARDGGLRQPQRTVNVTDTHFTGGQQAQDAEPGCIAQRVIHPCKFMNSRHEDVPAITSTCATKRIIFANPDSRG